MHVAIRPHPIFQRDGANIFCRVPLRMTQAALGGEVEVPAIDGTPARVKIPAGTQTGDQFRLRGKGFSVLRSAARGDMYDPGAVETPQNLTARQRELLEEFEAEAQGTARAAPRTRASSPRRASSSPGAADRGQSAARDSPVRPRHRPASGSTARVCSAMMRPREGTSRSICAAVPERAADQRLAAMEERFAHGDQQPADRRLAVRGEGRKPAASVMTRAVPLTRSVH